MAQDNLYRAIRSYQQVRGLDQSRRERRRFRTAPDVRRQLLTRQYQRNRKRSLAERLQANSGGAAAPPRRYY